MDLVRKNKQKICSGKITLNECGKNATLLLEDEWEEMRRTRGESAADVWIIPESRVISIRFPKDTPIGLPVRLFTGK